MKYIVRFENLVACVFPRLEHGFATAEVSPGLRRRTTIHRHLPGMLPTRPSPHLQEQVPLVLKRTPEAEKAVEGIITEDVFEESVVGFVAVLLR